MYFLQTLEYSIHMYTQQSHILVYNPNQTIVHPSNPCIYQAHSPTPMYILQIFSPLYTSMYILTHVFSTNQMIFNRSMYTHRHFHPCIYTYTHVNTIYTPMYTHTPTYIHIYTCIQTHTSHVQITCITVYHSARQRSEKFSSFRRRAHLLHNR